MKNILESISKSAEERIRNPFIGAFTISWLIFNWQFIYYILFSDKKVEEKLLFVVKNFHNYWYILVFPLLSSLFYLLIVPYVNLWTDKFVKKSKKQRELEIHENDKIKIQRETEIAKENVLKEIAVSQEREKGSHNRFVEELQGKIKILEDDLSAERTNNLEIVKSNSETIQNLDKRHTNEVKTAQEQLKQAINYMEHSRKEVELQLLLRFNSDEKFITNLIFFDNNIQILEIYLGRIKTIYVDFKEKLSKPNEEVLFLLKTQRYKITLLPMTDVEFTKLYNEIKENDEIRQNEEIKKGANL